MFVNLNAKICFFVFFPDLIPTKLSRTKEIDESKTEESKSDDLLGRHVTVTKKSVDDKLFGLLIRRSTKNGVPILIVESRFDDTDLVPGDQLMAVDGVSVEGEDREAAVRILTECESSPVTLQVG